MIVEEYVKQSREELRQMFGEVGLKEDCERLMPGRGCMTCSPHNTGRHAYQQCELGVCYFYKPEKRKEGNENG